VITPLDIQKKEFRRGLRGYREEEVDAFLDQIIEDYENLFRENQALKEKLAMLEQNIGRYRKMEEVLKNTMIMAQKNSDELRQNAEKEASLLLDQAFIGIINRV
jgi:cell division initiation protein